MALCLLAALIQLLVVVLLMVIWHLWVTISTGCLDLSLLVPVNSILCLLRRIWSVTHIAIIRLTCSWICSQFMFIRQVISVTRLVNAASSRGFCLVQSPVVSNNMTSTTISIVGLYGFFALCCPLWIRIVMADIAVISLIFVLGCQIIAVVTTVCYTTLSYLSRNVLCSYISVPFFINSMAVEAGGTCGINEVH